jgi:enoyl-CoA hydratase
METPVLYESTDRVATLTMDDGKVNVMSRGMQEALHHALDRAESDNAVVVLTGRPGVFSAGFDLKTLRAGGPDAQAMVIGGFELSERLLSFPFPVVIACTGHAIAMGMFLLLSGDFRVGPEGPFKFQANEVAIGLTMPRAAIEVLRQRMSPGYIPRAVTLAETFTPANAVAAGILDEVVPQSEVAATARRVAEMATTLDTAAHRNSKLLVRQSALDALRKGIEADNAEFTSIAN